MAASTRTDEAGGRSPPAGWAGAGCWCTPAGSRMSPYADIKPPGEDTKTAPRKLWHSSPGSSGAEPDRWARHVPGAGQALGWAPCQLSVRAPVSSGAAPPAPPWCGTPCARCSRPGTPTGRPPWSTSAAAPAGSRSGSPSSATGWSSSTPAPTLSPTLARRADESGVADLVTGRQGDLATLPDLVPDGSADVVLCHGVLEIVDDPAAALAALARCCVPAARSACWSTSGTRPSSPGRWPATSPRPGPCSRPAVPGRRRRGPPVHRRRGHRGARRSRVRDPGAARASGCSSTWCPSSLVDLEPGCGRGPGRARAGGRRPCPSTSPSPPRSTRAGDPPLTRSRPRLGGPGGR